MSMYLNSGTLATGGSMNCNLAIHDEDKSDLHEPRYNWTYQMRNAKQAGGGGWGWMELWPTSRGMSGDPTQSLYAFGQDAGEGGRFEWQPSISRGMIRPYFIRGQVKDAGGTAVTGCNVQAYLTATDQYVGATYTDSNGNYELPTIFTGQAHYCVAYNDGNNQAGTTINTLMPAL